MTILSNTLTMRKLVLVPAAILMVGTTTSSDGGEQRVHVKGGKMVTQVENGKFVLKGLEGTLGGGQIQMAGNVVADSEELNSAAVKFADIPLAQAAEMIGKAKVSGWMGNLVISGFVKGEWQGKGLTEIASSANGAMVIETGPGTITDPIALAQLAKATGIVELPELEYSNVKIQARAVDGNIIVDFIRAEGPEFTLSADGTYNAEGDMLDLKIKASVSPELAAKSSYMKLNNVMSFFRGEEATDADGKFVDVPRLVVSGELRKPEVTVAKEKVIAAPPAAKVNNKSAVATADSLKRVSQLLLSQSAE